MHLAKRRITAPTDGRPIIIAPLGDIHMGAGACDLDHFRRTRDFIARTPNTYALGMGDYGDLIMPSDPRWAWSVLDWKRLGYVDGRPDPEDLGVASRDLIARELDPIGDKLLGIHIGNHEKAFSKHYFVDVGRFLAKRYDVPYLAYTALTRLDIVVSQGPNAHHKVWAVTIFSEHGAAGGGTAGNAVNQLQKRGAEFDADLYLKGHVHQRGYTHKSAFGWSPSGLKKRDRLFVLTGTYLKGYTEYETTYGEMKAYPPNEIGGMALILDPKRERIHAVDVETVAALS